MAENNDILQSIDSNVALWADGSISDKKQYNIDILKNIAKNLAAIAGQETGSDDYRYIRDVLNYIDETVEKIEEGGGGKEPVLQSKTISPTTSQQTVNPDEGYDGLLSVIVNAISPTKAAQTYTPGTTNQTIQAGRWLTGLQTIKGDANLVASNIKSGVSIFGVMGNYVGDGGLKFYKDTLYAYNGTMYFVVGKCEDGNGEYACDFFLDDGNDAASSGIFGSWKKVFGGNGVEYTPTKMKVIGMFTDGISD